MELFIRIVDGQPFEHPILGDNFRKSFPHIDTNNLPPEFRRFVRVLCPEPDEGKYIVSASSSYQWDGDVIKDVWEVVQEDIPIDDLSGNIDDLSGNIDDLSGNIDDLSGNIDNLSGNIDNLSGNIDNLSGNIEGFN